MKIVFMGTPIHAAEILTDLIKKKYQILCVITPPDRPKGRGQKIAFSPVKEVALKHDLPIEQPEKVKGNQELATFLEALKPEVIVVIAYGKILPKEILRIPKKGCLNVHASLLPKYRGAAPVQWAILKGEEETGVTVMKLDELLDTGDILLQKKVKIKEDDTTITLMDRLFKVGGKLLIEALEKKIRPIKQNDADVTYAPMLTKESGELDWRKSAREIHDRVRALIPWPAAHTFHKEKLLKLLKTELHVLDLELKRREPGTIIEVVKNIGFIVATGKGDLLIKEVQPAGKKGMGAYNFAIGHDLKSGETLPN